MIGINVAKAQAAQGAENVGFAIPSTTVVPVAEQLIEEGEVSHPYLGIRGATLTPQVAERFGIDLDRGVVVADVEPGGPAAEAGIEPGSVIGDGRLCPRRASSCDASVTTGTCESAPWNDNGRSSTLSTSRSWDVNGAGSCCWEVRSASAVLGRHTAGWSGRRTSEGRMFAALGAALTVFVVAVGFLLFVRWVGTVGDPRRLPHPETVPFLGGQPPQTHAWSRFHVRYYALTLLFIAFEMEMMFMYPWAVVYAQEGVKALAEMGMFLGILTLGIVYAWREGAFEWQ